MSSIDLSAKFVDQKDLLLGKMKEGRSTFIYDQAPKQCVGIRKGKWKLLVPGREPEKPHWYLMDFGTNDYELYNLDKDMGEKKNLADKHPEIVEELISELENFKSTTK